MIVAPPNPDRGRRVAQRIVCDHARDKVAQALYESIVDGLEFGPRDLPRASDREWVRGAIAMPLQEATTIALDALVRSIAQTLDRAPDGLLDRFEASHHLADLGFE